MDPQQSPVNQPTPQPAPPTDQPTPPAAPIAPPASQPTQPVPTPIVAPSPVAQQPVTPDVVATPSPVTPAPAKSSKVLLFSVIGGAIVVIAAALAIGWLLYLSPAAQSKRLSNNFMHDMTTGNATGAAKLAGSGAQSFLTASSSSVHGSYSLSKSQFSNNVGYYLYTLTGASNKYARTIVKVDGGKRVVDSFVYDNTPLVLVPSTSTSTTYGTDSNTSSSTSTTDTASCLGQGDFSDFSNLGGQSLVMANTDGTYSDVFQVKFDPNVATYTAGAPLDTATLYSDFKSFVAYIQSAHKSYAVELEASVNSATPDDQLATARDNQIKSDLEASGIPASDIHVQPNTNDTGSDDAGNAFYRQVQITLTSSSSCTPAS